MWSRLAGDGLANAAQGMWGFWIFRGLYHLLYQRAYHAVTFLHRPGSALIDHSQSEMG
jgi:hypothetical protein